MKMRIVRLPVHFTALALAVLCVSPVPADSAAAESAAASANRAPVLLRSSTLLPPIEAVGTDVTPEVKVRVQVDRRGAVSDVEILDIDPSTELDAAFERTTVRELRSWRYAPAVENGEAVATTLDWTVQFRSSESGAGTATGSPLDSLEKLDERLRRRNYVRELPALEQKRVLEDYSRIAEQHIDPQRRQMAQTPRFVVVTDLEAENAAQIIAGNLEAVLNTLETLYQPSLEPHPHGFKTLVYLYRDRSSLLAMQRDIARLSFDNASYLPPGLVSAELESIDSDQLLAILIHEASHAYADHHLRKPGVEFPTWLEEGLAQYMENSRIQKGELIPGKTLRRKFVLNHFTSGATLRRTGSGWGLETVKKSLYSGEGLSLEELMGADSVTFYADERPLYYSTSWLFVHFLRHGRDGWADVEFPKMVLYLSEGYSGHEVIPQVYGMPLKAMEEEFLVYVKKF